MTFADDMRGLGRALTEWQRRVVDEVFGPIAAAVHDLLDRLRRGVDPVELVKLRLGPGQQTGDDLWQTTSCATWLHDECRAPQLCDCTCHGGELR